MELAYTSVALQVRLSMPGDLPSNAAPEIQLLVCCARTAIPPDVAEQVRSLVTRALDWDRVFSAAVENSVAPLLERQLDAVAPGALATPQKERLAAMNRESALRGLKLTAALLEILEALEKHRVTAIPYKGPVLALKAYGDLSLRDFSDVDILVAQSACAQVHETMIRLGYRPGIAGLAPNAASSIIPGEYKYYRDDSASIVEFHTERTLRHFPVVPDLEDFARRGDRMVLSGREIRTLSPEDTLIALCVHGTKDFWARLLWVADVMQTIETPGLDWDVVFRRATALRAQRMLRLGMILAQVIFDARIPREFSTLASRDAAARALAFQITQRLLLSDPEPPGAVPRFSFRRRSVPGIMAGWRYAMRLATAPAQDDVQAVPLSRPLRPLYALLRPFRLLAKSRVNE